MLLSELNVCGAVQWCYNHRACLVEHVCVVFSGSVVPVSEDTAAHTLLGVLQTLRQVVPHLGASAQPEDSLRDSFGAKTKQERIGVSTQQLVQVSIR